MKKPSEFQRVIDRKKKSGEENRIPQQGKNKYSGTALEQ